MHKYELVTTATFKKVVKGATRKKLNQAALREMKIKWRTLEEQKNIVSVLKEIELCITICRKMSGLLNELVKSRLVADIEEVAA